ncbi:MAG: DUF58 domain-containing protein [Candidatus Sulfobium sp.]
MKTTREGRRFVLLALLIAVAAVNTGNNLIYLIFALMFSVAVLAVVLLKVNVSGLALEVSFEGPVFAGEPAYAAVLTRNNKRFVPSYSLRVAADGAVSPVYFGLISAGGAAEKAIPLRFERRGLYGHRDFFIESGFPFILLNSRRAAGVSGEILVYPALVKTDDMIAGSSRNPGEGARIRSSSGDEIYSVREYRHGDDRRRIHWKATAKTGALMVKEYAEGEYRKATVVIDNLSVPGDESRRVIRGRGERHSSGIFEKAVSIAGSLAGDLLDRGYLVRLMSCRKVIPFGTGRDHFLRILDILAVIGEEPSWDSPRPDGDDLCVSVVRSRLTSSNLPFAPPGPTVYADSL